MCGIVGYVGGQQAAPILLEGLTRLEHRGYDSAGLAVLGGSGLRIGRRAGRVRDLARRGGLSASGCAPLPRGGLSGTAPGTRSP